MPRISDKRPPAGLHCSEAHPPGDEDRFRAIFEHAATGIGVADADGRILRANKAYCELLDYAEGELLDTPFLALTHPDDRDRKEEQVRRLLAGEIPNFVIESRVIRRDGGERWVRSSVSLIRDTAGNPANMVAVIEDITGHRRAEERLLESERRERARAAELAAVLEAVPAVVLVAHDPECRRITGSHATYALLRRPPGSNISKSAATAETSHFKVMKDGHELTAEDLPLQRAARGETVHHHEEQIIFDDGESRYLYGHAIPLRDERGMVRGAVGAFLDITERKRIEIRLREAKREAVAASRAKSAFLANMSHELRTPLNAIMGFADALAAGYAGPLAPKQAEYVRDIHAASAHLLRLVNDVLDLSKVEVGRLELSPEPVDLRRLIEACTAIVREPARNAGLRLAVEIPPDLAPIQADVVRLKQVFLNLLSNAIKFTPRGGEVRLTAEQNDTVVTIAIRDTGIGMRPEDLPVAFEPFGQIDASLSRRYEGTGLGLSLSKNLIELHGGRLEIETALGAGTTVFVTLPRSATTAG